MQSEDEQFRPPKPQQEVRFGGLEGLPANMRRNRAIGEMQPDHLSGGPIEPTGGAFQQTQFSVDTCYAMGYNKCKDAISENFSTHPPRASIAFEPTK